VTLEHIKDNLKRFLIFWREKIKGLTWATDTCSATTTVDIDFGIERTLIMEDIVYIRDVKTASCDVSANKNNLLAGLSFANLHGSSFKFLNARFKSVKTL
jgi:hypothetical protein